VKTRAEANGSSKKLVKQKGTGGARKGNLRSPIYKGGGTIFGPKPHSYDFKLNRKVKDLAKISALSYKAKENAIVVVEDLIMDAPKSKQFAGILKSLQISDKKTLFVLPEDSENVYLSLRNIPGVQGTLLSDVNTYDIVNASVLVFTESVAKVFTEEEVEA
jgi:large subunit ribosomal protein L4